ncbi:DUF2510 domain-containing protein [Herbiconiux sp. 11R-BC]|uniref:DUF2510 domain-containing protein n=1 Tax=Herbiconiux sp. 11R-BC TaxID=3111637 RepID=UPI003C00ED2F
MSDSGSRGETVSSAPPGWYPDQQRSERWWDGTRWTELRREALGRTEMFQTERTASLSLDERQRLVQLVIANAISTGWRLESVSATSAVLLRGRRPNHALHLVLTILSVGLWGVVWAVISVATVEQRMSVQIDHQGIVSWTDLTT